jgi:TolA-binding protein
MGFGSTAKKLQKVADIADDLYAKVNEQREQLQELRSSVETTSDHVEAIDQEQTKQRALLEALAEEQGLDTDAILAETEINDSEPTADDQAAGGTAAGDGGRAETEDQPPAETTD